MDVKQFDVCVRQVLVALRWVALSVLNNWSEAHVVAYGLDAPHSTNLPECCKLGVKALVVRRGVAARSKKRIVDARPPKSAACVTCTFT